MTLLSAVPRQSEELAIKGLIQPMTCDAVELSPAEAAVVNVEMYPADAAVEEDTSEVSGSEALPASEEMVSGLVTVLTHWVKEAANQGGVCKPGPFHSLRPPNISIGEYLKRVRKYFFCSVECFLIALIYMDRVGKISTSMAVNDYTVHRLLLVSVMLAAKFQDDVFYSNRYYAEVGGMKVQEVNRLEAGMLRLLGWKMFVLPQEYQLYHSLVSEATCQGN